MTNATKSLAIIFVIALILTILVKWDTALEASEAFRSSLVDVDTSLVDRITIKRAADPVVTLQKKGRKWLVSGETEEQFPADAAGVIRSINRLNNLEVKAVATRDPNKYSRYQVEDSTGIRVGFFNGEENLNTLYVGAQQRGQGSSSGNYVRLADDETVYLVEGYIRSTYNKSVTEWRDKMIWDLNQDRISRIDFMYPADSSFSIERAEDQVWVSEEDTLSQSQLRPVLRDLSTLRASGFATSASKENFGDEVYGLKITLSGEEGYKQLRLKESPGDTNKYWGVTPLSPYIFSFNKNTWDNRILKSRSQLLEEN